MCSLFYIYLRTSYNFQHMKKFIFSFTVFLLSTSLLAQSDPLGDFNRHVLANWSGNYHRISQYRVKGTPFLYGESFPGTIDYKGGKTIKGINVLYDLYTQASGIDLQKNYEIFEAEEGVEKFTVQLSEKYGAKTLVFVNANQYTNDYKGYYNLLADGEKVALLKAFKLKLLPDQTNQMARDIRVAEQYFEYYVFNKSTKQLQKVKLKEKDLLKELNAPVLAKGYIKTHNLDISKEDDSIKFITGFNKNFQ